MAAKDTVTVGCKVPQGLVLDIYGAPETHRAGITPTAIRSFTLKGSRFPKNDAGVAVKQWNVQGGDAGFGITEGVPADFWAAWLEQHKDSELVTNGIVFAVGTVADAEAEAKSRETVKSGMEPIDPDAPQKQGVPGIEKSDEKL